MSGVVRGGEPVIQAATFAARLVQVVETRQLKEEEEVFMLRVVESMLVRCLQLVRCSSSAVPPWQL